MTQSWNPFWQGKKKRQLKRVKNTLQAGLAGRKKGEEDSRVWWCKFGQSLVLGESEKKKKKRNAAYYRLSLGSRQEGRLGP